MWFFVFSINFARTREGRPARRKLTELLVKSKKLLSPSPPPSFLFFKSIFHVRLRLLSFTSSMLHLVWSGAIIGDGDRNWVSFSVMGLSLSKKTNVLFLAKIAPYARDARACNC